MRPRLVLVKLWRERAKAAPPVRSKPMDIVRQICVAVVLVTLTLVLQCAGMAFLIEWAKAHLPASTNQPDRLRDGVLMVRLTSLIVFMHVVEILLWACFFRARCFPTFAAAFYFSATSYSTVGYGDLVLQGTWRQLGPIESLTGVLMCGLSAAFLFAVVFRLVERDNQPEAIEHRGAIFRNGP